MIYITDHAKKLKLKSAAYQNKLQARRESRFDVTDANAEKLGDYITQCLFGLNLAVFAVQALQKFGAFPDDSRITAFSKDVNLKVESFRSNLEADRQRDFDQQRILMEDFCFNFIHQSPEKKTRIMKFAESIWNKK